MELFNIYDYLQIIFCGSQVPSAIKEKVINAWLEARPRNIIADETEIIYGSVLNIMHRPREKA